MFVASSNGLEADENEDRLLSVRRALTTGALVWSLFFGLDLFVVWVAKSEGGVAWFATLRLLGLGILLGCGRTLRPGVSSARVTIAEFTGFAAAALLVSIMAVRFRGLESPYAHALAIIILYHAASVPQHWVRILVMGLATAVTLPAVLAVGAIFNQGLAANWRDPTVLGHFAWNFFLILATTSTGALAAHSVWAARRQVHEKEQALAAVQRDLSRVREGARHGRLTGQALGRYRMGEVVGRGSMGEVYQSWRASDSHVVAVKVLHPHLTDETSVTRLRREADVTARLPAGLVPAVYEVGSVREQHFIAMEYLRGEDLGTFLRREAPLALDRVTALVIDVARAVAAVHEASIVHRDLKPQNVFLVSPPDGTRRVSLLDFGIAKMFETFGDTLTSSDALLGTPGYMAPEQARGEQDIGPAADVFALGVMAYYALVGERPFAARPLVLALHETMNVTPKLPSRMRAGVSVQVDAVFARVLAKDRRARYESTTDFALALESAVAACTASEGTRFQTDGGPHAR